MSEINWTEYNKMASEFCKELTYINQKNTIDILESENKYLKNEAVYLNKKIELLEKMHERDKERMANIQNSLKKAGENKWQQK